MRGGLGNDTMVASQANERIVELPGEGWDWVIARGATSFTLGPNLEGLVLEGTPIGIGNELSNRIIGDAGANQLFGRNGNDTLEGGAGNDTLFGEAGADSFLFAPGSGFDVIADFTPGQDRILIRGYAGLTSYAAVMAVTRDAAGGAIIDFSPGNAVQLAGIAKSALAPDDFAFLG
jgi:Ca2+-binding RTX toxin-like protein